MKIVEYDAVDPLGVLHLNLSSLGYALTPERAALIRRVDARPFPFFGVYAVEDGVVVGQVGVYRLPMVSTEGREDVGGVCAVCTHPAFERRGIASRLLDEAHERMRAAGLRFSTLGTARYRMAYALYRRLGYEDAVTSASALIRREAIGTSNLQTERAGKERLPLTDEIFRRAASNHLGFAWRHESFINTLVTVGDVGLDTVWLLRDGEQIAGYAIVNITEAIATVSDLVLVDGVEAVSAVAAIARASNVSYVRVAMSRPAVIAGLRQAGDPVARPDWGTFMIKPLTSEVTVEDARRLFGIGTDRYLMAWMDVT